MIGNHDNDDRPGNYKVDMPEASFFTGPKESNLRTVSRLKDFQGKKFDSRVWMCGVKKTKGAPVLGRCGVGSGGCRER